MFRFPISLSVLSAAALFFTGCLGGTGTSTEHQPTGLYRCIGESGYAPGDLEEIMRDIKAQTLECTDPVTGGIPGYGPEQIAPVSGDTVLATDSTRIHAVVLDERCNVVREDEKSVPEKDIQIDVVRLWNTNRADGTPSETGIYYVNVATERADGLRDTSYVKVGMVRDPCAP